MRRIDLRGNKARVREAVVLGATMICAISYALGQSPDSAQKKIVMNSKDGQNYVWIPAGTFTMGCSAGDQFCRPPEGPAHPVTLTQGFWMGQTPVTQAAYKKVMGANPSKFQGTQLPVDSVSWDNANAYCEKVGMRLPTEAEWEYAERGGSSMARYASIARIAWYKEDSGDTTQAVGLKLANDFGLYDMLGNVVEWTNDWWGNYSSSPAKDPQGPSSGRDHVLRGGAWWSCPEDLRMSARFGGEDGPNGNVNGFRCVAAAIPASSPAAPLHRGESQPYRISSTWKVDGDNVLSKAETEASWANIKSDESWSNVAIDSSSGRLYIARETKVEVLNTATGKLAGSIDGLSKSCANGTTINDIKSCARGIALDTAGKYGFVSDGGNHAVVVFDRKSLNRVASIDLGVMVPETLVFEPATHTVWSFGSGSNNVAVIDSVKLRLIDTIALPGKPKSAVADGHGMVYDTIADKNEIARIDARARKVTAEWPVSCQSPSAIAIDATGHRLFSTCRNRRLIVLDDETGKVLASPNVGEEADGVAFSAKYKLAFVASNDGFLNVIDFNAPGYPTVEKLITYPGAVTLSYDPARDLIYTVSADTQMISPPERNSGPDRQMGPPSGEMAISEPPMGPPHGQMGGGPPDGEMGPPDGGGGPPNGGGGPPHGGQMGSRDDGMRPDDGPQNFSDPRSHGASTRIVIPGTLVAYAIGR